jgi:hypothetical protein
MTPVKGTLPIAMPAALDNVSSRRSFSSLFWLLLDAAARRGLRASAPLKGKSNLIH